MVLGTQNPYVDDEKLCLCSGVVLVSLIDAFYLLTFSNCSLGVKFLQLSQLRELYPLVGETSH